MVFQGQKVHHSIATRLDASLFAVFELVDGGFICVDCLPEEVFHRAVESRAADFTTVLFISILLRRLKLGNAVGRPNEPQFFGAYVLIKPNPALFWDIDRLAARAPVKSRCWRSAKERVRLEAALPRRSEGLR